MAKDLEYDIVEADDPYEDLQTEYYMSKPMPAPVLKQDGGTITKALRLQFSLKSSSYATVFLRELTRNNKIFTLPMLEQSYKDKGGATGQLSTTVSGTKFMSKLLRTNAGQKIVPVQGKRNVMVTCQLPTVCGPAHLGKLIEGLLSADVFARFCRLMGHNTIFVSGTNDYGYGHVAGQKAKKQRLSRKEYIDRFHQVHKGVYEWFDIDTDFFGQTSTERHAQITKEIFQKLTKRDNTIERAVEQHRCPKADNQFLDAGFI